MTIDENRDQVAEERDRAAEERDRAAEGRDRAADTRDRSGDPPTVGEREQAARDRADAARDRERAARDRERAAGDRREAGVDRLTGALSRDRGLVDLQREIDRARRSDGRLAVAFVDVDGLKAVNDSLGHAAGDELLRDVAGALRTGLRSYDLVLRYGGDEFLCALPGTGMEGARRRFEQVEGRLTERNPRASLSIGLAELADSDALEDLVARADAALYDERRRARGGSAGGGRFSRAPLHPGIRETS